MIVLLFLVVICSTCGEECNDETGIGKIRLRDRIRVYRQHIRQTEYQSFKLEEHLTTCGEDTFEIFPLLRMRSSTIDLRRSYEKKLMKKKLLIT